MFVYFYKRDTFRPAGGTRKVFWNAANAIRTRIQVKQNILIKCVVSFFNYLLYFIVRDYQGLLEIIVITHLILGKYAVNILLYMF